MEKENNKSQITNALDYIDSLLTPEEITLSNLFAEIEKKKIQSKENQSRIFITGDTHGDFTRVDNLCRKAQTTINDVLIILGDTEINYWLDWRDKNRKKKLSKLPITLFCIHGNHEARPQTIQSYKEKQFHEGTVFYEEKYPNILFAKDGEVFDFYGKKCLVIGGAYSVDKFHRIEKGMQWFPDEQPDAATKRRVINRLKKMNYEVDVILSHTCPLKYEPVEVFLSYIDQSKVDKSTEKWLGGIEKRIKYQKWYCGHYHTDKSIDKIRFLFKDVVDFF